MRVACGSEQWDQLSVRSCSCPRGVLLASVVTWLAVSWPAGRSLLAGWQFVFMDRLAGASARRLDGGVQESGQRHGDKRAGDAAERRPGDDREHHRERMEVDAAAHDEWLEQVPLYLHQNDDRDGDDDRAQQAVLQERDRRGERAGDRQADQRDERAEEDEHAQRCSERDAQHEQHIVMEIP